MDYKKIITGFLSKTLKIDDGKIAEILEGENVTEETATKSLLDLDVSRVLELKKGVDQEKFQEGYKKAKKEERSAFETELKTAFNFDGQDTGVDLVKAIVGASSTGGGKGEITEDAVKRHKVYQDLLDNLNSKVAETEKTWQEKYTQLESTHKRDTVVGGVKSKALNILDSLKPVYPKNQEAATNLKNTFASTFAQYDYEEQDGRTLILKDGKVLTDQHGNRIQLDDLIKDTANKYFDFQQSSGGGNGGNGGGGNGGGSGSGGAGGSFKEPTTLAELTKIIDDPNISHEDKNKAIEAFDKLG